MRASLPVLTLVALAALATTTNALCDLSSISSDNITLIAPSLSSTATLTKPELQFEWSRIPLPNGCAAFDDEIYEVFLADNSSWVFCQVTATDRCTPADIPLGPLSDYLGDSNLTSVQIKWGLRATLDVANNVFVESDPYLPGTFYFCLDTPPKQAPAPISPINGNYSTVDVRNIQFDFALGVRGRACNSTVFWSQRITVTNMNNTNETYTYVTPGHVSPVAASLMTDLIAGAKPGEYEWTVTLFSMAFESVSSTGSFSLYFQPLDCVDCGANGVCNTTTGACVCTPPYFGTACTLLPATMPPPGPPADEANLAPIIGGAVGGSVAAIIIIGLLVWFFWARKLPKDDTEMAVLVIEAPSFEALAYEPYRLQAHPFTNMTHQAGRWSHLEALLTSQDNGLVWAILSTAKIFQLDYLTVDLVCLHHRVCNGRDFVMSLMEREMAEFDRDANREHRESKTLEANPMPFRGDSAATKAFKVYSRILGLPYLFETLGQILNDFCTLLEEEQRKRDEAQFTATHGTSSTTSLQRRTNSGSFSNPSLEVDPTRLQNEEDQTINRLSLQLICQKVFVKIHRSAPSFPRDLRAICAGIKQNATKYSSMNDVNHNTIVSNMVFLRFINPSIIMPRHYGLVAEEPSASTKRQLVLITKVMQNLSAGVEFGKKEEFMAKLNPFIQQNMDKMQNFLNELATVPIDEPSGKGPESFSAPVTEAIYAAAIGRLYAHVHQHLDAILAALQREAPATAASTEAALRKLLEEIGAPPPDLIPSSS